LADVAGDELGGQLVDALVGEALGPQLGAGLVGQEPGALDLGGLGLGDLVGGCRVLLVDVGRPRGRVGVGGACLAPWVAGAGGAGWRGRSSWSGNRVATFSSPPG